MIREEISVPVQPAEKESLAEAVSATRGALDPETFRLAWDEGRRMPLGRVIDAAMTTAS